MKSFFFVVRHILAWVFVAMVFSATWHAIAGRGPPWPVGLVLR